MRIGLVGLLIIGFCRVGQAVLDDGLYAAFETNMGSFTCRLDYAEAPLTCANFVGLVEGSQSYLCPTCGVVKAGHYYDGLLFHRVIDGFMIQGGCPLGTGTSGPGYTFPDEFTNALRHASAGVLSMANSGPNSNGSQFFITLANTDWLDDVHSVFGEVVAGMNVVTNIGGVETTNSARPLKDVVMEQVVILRVGAEAEAFSVTNKLLPEVSALSLSMDVTSTNFSVCSDISKQHENKLFYSFDLQNWSSSVSKYAPLGETNWKASGDTTPSSWFFRGAQVNYPVVMVEYPLSVNAKSVTFRAGMEDMSFHLNDENEGVLIHNGEFIPLVYWAWERQPYSVQFTAQDETYDAWRFTMDYQTSTNECKGEYFWWGQWLDNGEWTIDISDATVPL